MSDLNLNRLKWLGVWLPVVGLGGLIILLEAVIPYFGDGPRWSAGLTGHVVLMGAVTAGAYLFSNRVFRIIRQKTEETLRQNQELAAIEKRFRALIENSSDGIVLLGTDGTVQYASPSTTRVLGYAAEDLFNRSAFELIHPKDRANAMVRFTEALQNPGGSTTAEFRVQHKNGSWLCIEAVASNLLADASVQALVCNYRDITERKRVEEDLRQARDELETRVRERTTELEKANEALWSGLTERKRVEEALRESRAQLAGIIGSAMEAIITVDENQRIVVFNAAAERMFHIPAAEVMGQPVDRFIPPRFLPTHQEGVRFFGQTNLARRWVGVLGAATGLRADGEEFPIEAAISQVEVGGQKLYTVILRDITERKQAEEQLRNSREQLRALAAHLQSVREDERTRIAREIHDELGQVLTGLRMDLAWAASRIPPGETTLQERTKAMVTLVDSTIRLVRRIATELRPGVLDDLGLVAAIEWQAQEFQNRTGIACEFTSAEADLPLPPEVGTAVFRICQETLTNVARHAHATRVRIRLEAEGGQLALTVADNGRGITEREIANRTSLGLLGIRERVLLLGGQVSITGRPGEGTTVRMVIPLKRPEAQAGSGDGGTGQEPMLGAAS